MNPLEILELKKKMSVINCTHLTEDRTLQKKGFLNLMTGPHTSLELKDGVKRKQMSDCYQYGDNIKLFNIYVIGFSEVKDSSDREDEVFEELIAIFSQLKTQNTDLNSSAIQRRNKYRKEHTYVQHCQTAKTQGWRENLKNREKQHCFQGSNKKKHC